MCEGGSHISKYKYLLNSPFKPSYLNKYNLSVMRWSSWELVKTPRTRDIASDMTGLPAPELFMMIHHI